MTQQRSHFFLDVDDDVRLTQIFGQAGVLSAKFLDFYDFDSRSSVFTLEWIAPFAFIFQFS
jgi:hypothetical protein